MEFIWKLPRNFSILIIRIYQKTLSPDHGLLKVFFNHRWCRYEPTCSHYTIGTLQKYGFIKGWLKGLWRILRCNPFSKGGVDLP